MKHLKKSLITVSCAAALMAALAVPASAQGFGIVTGPGNGNIPSNLSGLIGQITQGSNCDLNDILQNIQKGDCVLPPQSCPDNQPGGNLPSQPNLPELPDFPQLPELPSQPDAPELPDTPDQPGQETPGESTESAYIAEVARLVNQERANAGLAPLSVNSGVQSAAQVRAREQAVSFSHTRPDGRSCFTALAEAGVSYSGAGENIAYGQRTPQEVMTGWMNSSGHRANILNASFTELGVGCYRGTDGTLYWAQMFIS